jgi:hypothetical protein
MMTTARILSVENKPDTSALLARLVSIQKNLLTIDDQFLRQHAIAFAGREYAKHLDLHAVLAAGEVLRKKLSSADMSSSYSVQKIEVEGFRVDINNKIMAYKADCAARIIEVTKTTGSHHKALSQRAKALREYRRVDTELFPNLMPLYDELINAYHSDLENMQEQREQFHTAMDEDNSESIPNLRDILVRLFYINRFEKSFLVQHNEKYQRLEEALVTAYEKNLKSSISKFHANLVKKQVILANFVLHFDKRSFVQLTAMLKVLQDVLRNVMRDTGESLEGVRANLQTIKKLELNIEVYAVQFYKVERSRRLSSACYHKLLAMSGMIEAEIVKSATQNNRMTILRALQEPLNFLMQFYIDGRTYKGLTTDHTPMLLESRLVQQSIDDTLKALTECLQVNEFKDEKLITWASQFLQKIHAVESKQPHIMSLPAEIASDKNVQAFSFAKELKEKELDCLVGQLTNSLYPAPVHRRSYSFLSMLSAKPSTVDADRLLIKMQYFIADKSEANLLAIIKLASQPYLPAHLRDELQNIATTARDVIEMSGSAVAKQQSRMVVSQSML